MFTNSKPAIYDNRLKWFASVWAIVIIAPLVYFPAPGILAGHPWKVELVMSFILAASLVSCLLNRRAIAFNISGQIACYIAAPCCALIVWSAASALWAGSILSVAHHTLIWACYLVFFLFAVQIVSDRKLFKQSVFALGAAVGVVCLCLVIEFVFEETINEEFGFRYGRYAEIFAALLPFFFSFALRLNRKHLRLAIFALIFLWLGLLFALSRGALLASIGGLSIFILLRLFSRAAFNEKRRLVFASAGLIVIAALTQISLFSNDGAQKASTLSRVSATDEKDRSNSVSQNVRFLFAGVGKEMFFENPALGVGADNFGLEFNKNRRAFSQKSANESAARLHEEIVPERAHNEFLQIAAELGIVGALIVLSLLFGIAKLGFAEIVKNRFERDSILTHAAVGGICAFLVSSMFSSFSFRLMQNGLIFFFLLAILLRNFAVKKNQETSNDSFVAPRLKSAFAAVALAACLSLTVFSALKAASQYLVYQAERQENFEAAQTYYENAILFDRANASANFSFGLRLLGDGKYAESAAQFRQSVNKGLDDSVAYSYLISAQTLANQPRDAVQTASEAVEIFPYSIFLRVRYAVLLEKFNEPVESKNQMRTAERLDENQAETWRVLINEGLLKANRASPNNPKISRLGEIFPSQGIYAVLAEREIVHPNEKMKFKF